MYSSTLLHVGVSFRLAACAGQKIVKYDLKDVTSDEAMQIVFLLFLAAKRHI